MQTRGDRYNNGVMLDQSVLTGETTGKPTEQVAAPEHRSQHQKKCWECTFMQTLDMFKL